MAVPSFQNIDLSEWDRTKSIEIFVQGIVTLCSCRTDLGITQTDLIMLDNVADEIFRISITNQRFDNPSSFSNSAICIDRNFTRFITIRDQIPENINFITLMVKSRITQFASGFPSCSGTGVFQELSSFDVTIPTIQEPEPGPEPDKGLSTGTKAAVVAAVGAAFIALVAVGFRKTSE